MLFLVPVCMNTSNLNIQYENDGCIQVMLRFHLVRKLPNKLRMTGSRPQWGGELLRLLRFVEVLVHCQTVRCRFLEDDMQENLQT